MRGTSSNPADPTGFTSEGDFIMLQTEWELVQTLTLHPISSPLPPPEGATHWISQTKAASLGSFLKSSVTRKTEKAYEGHWRQWCQFLVEELGETEPLLIDWPEQQKSIAVALFLQSHHQKGLREKQATAVTAGAYILQQPFSPRHFWMQR